MSLIFVFIGFFSPLVFFPLGLPLFIGDYGRRQHLKAALMFTLRSWRHLCLVSLSLWSIALLSHSLISHNFTFLEISPWHLTSNIQSFGTLGNPQPLATSSLEFAADTLALCLDIYLHIYSIYPSSRICCRHPLQPGLTASVSWEVMGRRWPAHVAQARYHGNNPTSWNAFAKKKLAKRTRLKFWKPLEARIIETWMPNSTGHCRPWTLGRWVSLTYRDLTYQWLPSASADLNP